MQRLLMLLDTDSPATLEAGLREHEAALREIALSASARLRLAVQLEGDPMSGDAAGDARTVVPLRGLVELTVDGDDPAALLDSVSDVAQELSGVVHWPSSAVSIGTVREVLPINSDVILLTLAANRLPTIDRSQFHDYWLNVHATLAMSLLDDEKKSKMGYEQIHSDETASSRATQLAGARANTYDGVLECSLAQITDLPHLTVPGFAETIMKDEENFADQSAEMLGAFMRTLPPMGVPS
jgi:EthD domain-containing protein